MGLLRKISIKKSSLLKNYQKNNVKICEACDVAPDTVFEGHNYIGYNSYFRGSMGFGSYIGSHSRIRAKIGRYCSISDEVIVVNGFHPTQNFISTHPSFYSTNNSVTLSYCNQNLFDEFRYADSERKFDVIIGNDVWIGKRVTIIAGVEIGDGAVIAAGSVVTKHVEPFSIVAGSPARVIRHRFDETQREKLTKLAWWNKDETWLRENADYMRDISKIDELLKE